MENKEQIWKEFCLLFRGKLKEITDPVALTNNRSYDALCDVISNVILLEINMDRKPWEEIPKAKVRLPTGNEAANTVIETLSPHQIATILLRRIEGSVSYNDRDANDMDKHTVASMGLFAALKTFLKEATDYYQ